MSLFCPKEFIETELDTFLVVIPAVKSNSKQDCFATLAMTWVLLFCVTIHLNLFPSITPKKFCIEKTHSQCKGRLFYLSHPNTINLTLT